MQPNIESDELSKMLEAGYAAPPLDDAFSSNLIRRLQAEVAPQTHLSRSRQAGWAVVLSGVAIAASLLTVIYILNPLRTKPAGDELTMQLAPSSNDELITSLESKPTRSLETDSIPTNDAKLGEIKPAAVPLVKSRGVEAVRGTTSFESKLESRSEMELRLARVQQESKSNESLSSLSKFESMSTATMEEFEVVTKERAKALGLSIQFQADGPITVRVSLEFEKQGEIKEYSRVELKQFNGDKLLLSVTLKEGESKPGRVIVGFVTARSHLETLSLKIVAKNPSGSRVGYVLPMKDLVELK